MPTVEKAKVIEQAAEWYAKSQGIVFTDFRGLTVKEIQTLRKQLKAKGGELHVVKNTLFRRAAGDDIAKIPDEYHNGTTAIAFLFQNESEGTKTLTDFATSSKKLAIKGGFFGGKAFDAKGVEAIGKLPPRDVLIAQVIGAVAAPLTNLVTVVEAIYAEPIRTIYAVVEKNGAPAEPEAPAAAPVAEAAPVEAEAAPAVEAEAPAEAPAADAPAEETPAEPAAEEAAADPAPEA